TQSSHRLAGSRGEEVSGSPPGGGFRGLAEAGVAGATLAFDVVLPEVSQNVRPPTLIGVHVALHLVKLLFVAATARVEGDPVDREAVHGDRAVENGDAV